MDSRGGERILADVICGWVMCFSLEKQTIAKVADAKKIHVEPKKITREGVNNEGNLIQNQNNAYGNKKNAAYLHLILNGQKLKSGQEECDKREIKKQT